jgi:hypothetical protein
MAYDTGAHHVQVDVTKAIPQMITAFNHRAMESFSQEGSTAPLAPVIVLPKLTLQLLHESAEVTQTVAHPEQMDMVAGNTESEKSDPVFLDRLPQAGAILCSIESPAQEELAVMTAVRQVIDISRLDIAIGTRHRGTSIR